MVRWSTERMNILQLNAACGWSLEQTVLGYGRHDSLLAESLVLAALEGMLDERQTNRCRLQPANEDISMRTSRRGFLKAVT